jgi:phosphoglycolate phosphatase
MTATLMFDLDGTLIDSLPDIAAAANRMLQDEGRPPLSQDTIQKFVGNGLPKLVERVIRHCDMPLDRHAELTERTLAHYSAASSTLTVLYPGVSEALQQLRDMGCVLGICTNKPESPARDILRDLDLAHHFETVFGGDTLNTRKPDPAHLHASFAAVTSTGPQLFIGDSEVDAETAQRAQVPFLLFTEGYRKSPVSEIPHALNYDHNEKLPSLVRQMISKLEETA